MFGFTGRCRPLRVGLFACGMLALALHHSILAADGFDPLTAEELTVEQALQVPTNQWEVKLPALKTLTPDVAKVLASKGETGLVLSGLTTLSPEVAAILAAKEAGNLQLSGLISLTPDVARELAKCRIPLYMAGLTELTPEVAAALSAGDCLIGLHGLTELTPEVAARLGRCTQGISLSGRTTLTRKAAENLAMTNGGLELYHMETLTPDVASGLAKCRSSLEIYGLKTCSPEVAAALSKCPGPLRLHGPPMIPPEAAESLVKCKGWDGNLSGLTALTPGLAAAVAERERLITLGIVAFEAPDSENLARTLATKKGPLALPHLKRISPKTLTALAAKEDVVIPPFETLELINEPDGSPTEDFVIPEGFQERQRK